MVVHFPENDKIKPDFGVTNLPKEENWLQRHVRWLRKEDSGTTKVLKNILTYLESIAAIISGIGIIALIQGIKFDRKLDARKAFEDALKNASPPRTDLKIEMKSPTATFNHAQEFVIHNKIIWYRLKDGESKKWSPIFFDGFPKVFPASLHADGANLIVLDNERKVHYKKVIHEYRAADLNPLGKQTRKIENVFKQLKPKTPEYVVPEYVVVDMGEKDNWRDEWFTLPVAHYFVNLIIGKRLTLPEGKAWSISHRGKYTDHYTDGADQKQRVVYGVTTLYLLSSDGKEITFFDPWSPAHMKIPVPDTPDSTFEAINLSVSAATIMLIGYESTPNESGGVDKVLKIKTRLSDIDVEGWDPGLDVTYFPTLPLKDDNPLVISWKDWEDHPLPKDAQLTGVITIFQVGEGNNARIMRVEGYNSENVRGYFSKNFKDKDWQFHPYNDKKSEETPGILERKFSVSKPFATSVSNYKGNVVDWPSSVPKPNKVELHSFGTGTFNSTLFLKEGGQGIKLHRRKTFLQFIGFGKDHYDLVIPDELANAEWIKHIFGNKRVIENVSVRELGNSEIEISWHRFRLKLKKA